MIHIKRGAYTTQAWGCWLCLHIGMTAIYLGHRKGRGGLRVELFTPYHRWRVS